VTKLSGLILLIFISLGTEAQTSIGFKGGYTSSSASYRITLGSFPRTLTGFSAPTYSFVIEQFFDKNAGNKSEN
jgi:hypothetical protein